MKINFFAIIFFILLIILVFKSWLFSSAVTGGDLGFYWNSMLRNYSLYPYAWNNLYNNGMGGNAISLLWLNTAFSLPLWLLSIILGFNWIIIEKIGFLYPILILAVISPIILFRKIFPENKFFLFAPFLYLFNTYTLMVLAGGQIIYALAFAFLPLLLSVFYDLQKYKNKYQIAMSGVLLALQMTLDLRVGVISMAIIIAYFIFFSNKKGIAYMLLAFIVAFLINAYWLLPFVITGQNLNRQYGEIYTGLEAVKFFSFAKLENSIAMLHPNWPQNIFGKVGFMKAEFLLIPVLAYFSILLKNTHSDRKRQRHILFFAIVGLAGAFLAKGAADPLGMIYVWLFDKVPGFVIFRDPTKWYIFVVLSYTMLIPNSIWNIYKYLETKETLKSRNFTIFNRQNFFIIAVIVYFLFLIRPALYGGLNGTFQTRMPDEEYVKLEKLLKSESIFSRALWVPQLSRFGYYSQNNPAVNGNTFFNLSSPVEISKKLSSENALKILNESSIKYIIVPYDSEKEIFLKNGEYIEKDYKKTINNLQQIKWLNRVPGFGKIAIFKNTSFRNTFFRQNNLPIRFIQISPVLYNLKIENGKKGNRLIMSSKYDYLWKLKIMSGSKSGFSSKPYMNRFNSFVIPQNGNYTVSVYYFPQKWTDYGLVISSITILILIVYIMCLKIKNRKF